MGNLTKALKENEHLKNQNRGLLDALKRKNSQLEGYRAESAEAIRQISEMTAAYVGALCLQNEAREIKLSHKDIKRVVENYDVEIETYEQGFIFKLVPKSLETQ